MSVKAENHNARWTKEEEERCLNLLLQDKSYEEVGKILDRKPTAVEFRKYKIQKDMIYEKGTPIEQVAKMFKCTIEDITNGFKKGADANKLATENTKGYVRKTEKKNDSLIDQLDREQKVKKEKISKLTEKPIKEDNKQDKTSDLKELQELINTKELFEKSGMIEEAQQLANEIKNKMKQRVNKPLDNASSEQSDNSKIEKQNITDDQIVKQETSISEKKPVIVRNSNGFKYFASRKKLI